MVSTIPSIFLALRTAAGDSSARKAMAIANWKHPSSWDLLKLKTALYDSPAGRLGTVFVLFLFLFSWITADILERWLGWHRNDYKIV